MSPSMDLKRLIVMQKNRSHNIIKKYSNNEQSLRQLVVGSFIRANQLMVTDGLLVAYLDDVDEELLRDIEVLGENFTIEDAITAFEAGLPMDEKIKYGAVYTPQAIRQYIVSHVLDMCKKNPKDLICADISCGSGVFLYTLFEEIKKRTALPCREIVRHLYGVDISEYAIKNAKVILSMAALQHGQTLSQNDFNLVCADSLQYDICLLPSVVKNLGFDIIVGNPPYCTSRYLSKETKEEISQWQTGNAGKGDLYIPFFEIAMRGLARGGIMGYITANTFFKSVNGRALREYFQEHRYAMEIMNFGNEEVFQGKMTYTCMTFISKQESSSLRYSKMSLSGVLRSENISFNEVDYNDLDSAKGWNLGDKDVLENIRKIENAGQRLGDRYAIRNGIATLANKIFIFHPMKKEEKYFLIRRNAKNYRIEKDICKDIIKPNTLKSEDDIEDMMDKVIYPYTDDAKIITEDSFLAKYPMAYRYLLDCRNILELRDKGSREYEAWFAWGRTQNMRNRGKKLLYPTIADKPRFIYSREEDLMLYNGNAIYGDDEDDLLLLKKILESSVFDYYIKNTAKPYSSGYFGYSKGNVSSFGVYELNESQRQRILACKTQQDINDYLEGLYGIKIS